MKRALLWFIVVILALPLTVSAQAVTATVAPNPNATITWPPPVYVIRGQFQIHGTANLPNMTNYFIEFRPLNDDLTPQGEQDVWFPAILPSQAAVQDGVLGTWDTTLVTDGLYQLRLTVNVSQGSPVFDIVSPLRIENTPSPFEVPPTPIATNTPLATATLIPTITPTVDTTPRVTITSSPTGNVRAGDSIFYNILTSLPAGTTAKILGISNRGTGWYQVQLDSGQIGWVSPSIVTTSGDLTGLQSIQPPPPPPPTPTPIPTAVPFTPIPATTANLVAGNVTLNPGTPQCNQSFQVKIDIANLGSQATASGGTVTVTDTRASDGSQQSVGSTSFGVIQPGQTINYTVDMTIGTYYNETHNLTVNIDPSNQIPETIKGDNVKTLSYTLAKAGCP